MAKVPSTKIKKTKVYPQSTIGTKKYFSEPLKDTVYQKHYFEKKLNVSEQTTSIFQRCIIFLKGYDVRHYNVFQVKHRDGDKPAVIKQDGTLEWWKEGKLHRDGDKPAIMTGKSLLFYKQGKLYREEHGDTVKLYDIGTGFLHDPAENHPAVFSKQQNSFQHYQNGKLHSTQGPAIRTPTGKCYYYLEGKHLTLEEWANHITK